MVPSWGLYLHFVGSGFGADEGASLLVAFRGLQADSIAQGEAHRSISRELESLVADPFEKWADGHKVCLYIRCASEAEYFVKERVLSSRNSVIDGWLKSYETAQGEVRLTLYVFLIECLNILQVDKLKHSYLTKVRRADEAEDEYVR